MKKRILSLLLIGTLCAALLAGCGGGGQSGGNADVDLSEFYATVTETYEVPSLAEIEGDILTNTYPGLEDISLKQQVLYMPMISSVAWEFAAVEAENSDDAQTVAGIFQDRIDAQAAGGAWYPETVEQWELHSKVVTHGNYVLLTVGENCDDIAADFEALFS